MGFGGHGILRKGKNIFQVFNKKYENEDFWKKFGIEYYDKYKDKKEWIKKQETLLVKHLLTLFLFHSNFPTHIVSGFFYYQIINVFLQN